MPVIPSPSAAVPDSLSALPDSLATAEGPFETLVAGQPSEPAAAAELPDLWADGLMPLRPSALLREIDSLMGVPVPTVAAVPEGVAGDPVPYQFMNDHFVAAALLVGFMLVAWVISRSHHFLMGQLKNFFRAPVSSQPVAERTESELQGQLFLVFQTCFVVGILFVDFVQERLPQLFEQATPHLLLAVGVGLTALFYGVKISLYDFINTVFFTRQQTQAWKRSYLLSVLLLGLSLLPLALLVVYFNLSHPTLLLLFVCTLGINKLFLLYKCARIFFKSPLALVHLFLYFCALEIVPQYLLLRALVLASNLLKPEVPF